MNWQINRKMAFRMLAMLLIVGAVLGGIFGYKAWQMNAINKSRAARRPPPVNVTAIKASMLSWQPQLKAVGSVRAARGVDVTAETAGLVRSIQFQQGEEAKAGQLLIKLNADADLALLRSLEAAAELAQIVYERDKKQFAIQAVSQATLDSDAADLKGRQAQVAQQAALVDKKNIRAPFAGRLGISFINPGQYINPGDKIVTLQSLDKVYVDFYLPQRELAKISTGQQVTVAADTYPGRKFQGKITTINPKVEQDSRNVQVEAAFTNSGRKLLPGMFVRVDIQAGGRQRYLTLPQTAITYNPYGETVYVVEEAGGGAKGEKTLGVRQAFVVVGPTRGDQVALLKGIKEGDMVVTSGQVNLRNGSAVIINNKVQPSNNANPEPTDE
jgi:membrane fusion protein, multidrug efflux system